jgi:hypothetical protein
MKPELAQNPRHTRMTFYGLPSSLVPKVSPELDLAPTDPNWKPPAETLRPLTSSTSKSTFIQNKPRPEKKKKFSSEVSLHRTRDGRIEKRSLIGPRSRPPPELLVPRRPHTDVVKPQYDLQTLQADLMTAQRISRDGTAGSIGPDMSDSVRMILNVLEGERAFERSLIKAEQASTSGTRQAPDLLVNFSDEPSESSGNESNVSDNEEERRDGSNVSSSSDEGNEASPTDRPRGSSASDHFWSDEENLLRSRLGVNPAPEVDNPNNKMEEDEILETQPTTSDMDLDSKKDDDATK